MPERPLTDHLDDALQAMLAGRSVDETEFAPLLEIARELRTMPRESFKAKLKSELQRRSSMSSTSEAIATTRQTARPRLRIRSVGEAIEFYQRAFGAREISRFEVGGQIPHAELMFGNTIITFGEEAVEWGYPGPETLGGSPVAIDLHADDVDAAVARAVDAGARQIGSIHNTFYGSRTGMVADPFGYHWSISMVREEMSVEEMHRRLAAENQGRKPAVNPVREGFHTVTPYVISQDAEGLIDFVKQVFGAEERFRAVGSAGGYHCEVRIGDSMMMIGGGGKGLSWKGESRPMAFHVYVPNTDALYRHALETGATSIDAPQDHEYGERGASVRDPFGNHWYIATAKGEHYTPQGLRTVNVYMHPLRAEPVIAFLKRGFGAVEVGKYASPEGVVHHAAVRVGDSLVEMGEAHGPYQPMPSTFYLYLPNVDAAYRRVLEAGATSVKEPTNQPYGDRVGEVKDSFGNTWYLGTQLEAQ